jgi:hypothetical protein
VGVVEAGGLRAGENDLMEQSGDGVRVLSEATEAVAARAGQYGPPSVNFERIANFANAWLADKLTVPLDVRDVAVLGMCMKLGRLLEDPDHFDSVVDIAGYANAYWEAAHPPA